MTNSTPNHTIVHISPQSVLTVLLILGGAVLAFMLRDLLLAVFAAVVIAAAVEAGVRRLRLYNIPRLPAVVIIYVGLAAMFVAIVAFLLQPLIEQTIGFLNLLPDYIQSLQAWTNSNDAVSAGIESAPESLSLREIIQEVRSTLTNVSGNIYSAISYVFGGIVSFVLIVVLSFYLSIQEQGVVKFLSLVTPKRYEEYVVGLWGRAERKIGLWVQGQLILALIIGILTYASLLILGVPYALVLAFLAGLFELVPLLGPILAAIPAIAVGLVDGGLTLGVIVLVLYIVIQQIESQIIYPLVVSKVVGLSPLVVIIALVAGAQLGGFLGIVLSVPTAAILMEFLNDVQTKRSLATAPKQSSEGTDMSNHTSI